MASNERPVKITPRDIKKAFDRAFKKGGLRKALHHIHKNFCNLDYLDDMIKKLEKQYRK